MICVYRDRNIRVLCPCARVRRVGGGVDEVMKLHLWVHSTSMCLRLLQPPPFWASSYAGSLCVCVSSLLPLPVPILFVPSDVGFV